MKLVRGHQFSLKKNGSSYYLLAGLSYARSMFLFLSVREPFTCIQEIGHRRCTTY